MLIETILNENNLKISNFLDSRSKLEDNEELKVSSIFGNKLTVIRGADSTTASAHVSGSEIKLITQADNALIQFGDDFGFDGIV